MTIISSNTAAYTCVLISTMQWFVHKYALKVFCLINDFFLFPPFYFISNRFAIYGCCHPCLYRKNSDIVVNFIFIVTNESSKNQLFM